MNNLLKQGDFVVVSDSGSLFRGIVITDEYGSGNQIYVAIVKYGCIYQNYYDKNQVAKVS